MGLVIAPTGAQPDPQGVPEEEWTPRVEAVEADEAGITMTPAQRAAAERANAQLSTFENLQKSFEVDTALGPIADTLSDEVPLLREQLEEEFGLENDNLGWIADMAVTGAASAKVLLGGRAEGQDYDKEEHYDALTAGIPVSMHDEILDEPTLEAAQRERQRMLKRLETRGELAQQYDGGVSQLMGSMLDVDAPLAVMSGGALGAATAAKAGVRAAKAAGAGFRVARAAGGLVEGLNAGGQAGVVTGLATVGWDGTANWSDAATQFAGGLALGGVLGPVLGPQAASGLQDEILRQVASDTDVPMIRDADIAALPHDTVPMRADEVVEGVDPKTQGPLEFDPDAPGGGEQGVGAAQNPYGTAQRLTIQGVNDPAGPTSSATDRWSKHAQEWKHESGWADVKAEEDREWLSGLMQTKIGRKAQVLFGNSFFNDMYTSSSNVANWLSGTVFESGSSYGRGKATASVLKDIYERELAAPLRGIDKSMQRWAQQTDNTFQNSGYGVSEYGKQQFYREVMLERNNRLYGHPTTQDPFIKDAADRFDEVATRSWKTARGRDDQRSVNGFENVKENPHYTMQKWDGRKINDAIKAGRVTRANIQRALARGYVDDGIAPADADIIADAVISRAIRRGEDSDTSVAGLLNHDGQAWLEQVLRDNGMADREIGEVTNRLTGVRAEKRRQGWTKSKNTLDYSGRIEDSDMQIVDLLSTNLHEDFMRYTREVAGSSALARVGITDRTQRTEIAEAVRAEQRAAGEEPTPMAEFEAMFSHFDGGGVKGYSSLQHSDPAPAGRNVALLKRMTNLAYLGKMGLTQLGETGAQIAKHGFFNWWNRSMEPMLDRALRADRDALLDDMAALTGDIGHDQHLFAEHLDLDEWSPEDGRSFFDGLDKLSKKATYVQGYLSGFNHVRKWQQQATATLTADKIFRTLKDDLDGVKALDGATKRRFWADFGLDDADLRELQDLIEFGTIEFKTAPDGRTYVNRLNAHLWGASELGDNFGAGVVRHLNQAVQKSLPGEQDAWMHTALGSIFTHLKTFPMAAVNKQAVRNLRHLDQEAMMAVLYGMSTAGLTFVAKELLKGESLTDIDGEELMDYAFNYANITGWAATYTDPLQAMLFGQKNWYDESGIIPPSMSWAQQAIRIPGAAVRAATGDAGWQERQALRALPFANVAGVSSVISSIGKSPKSEAPAKKSEAAPVEQAPAPEPQQAPAPEPTAEQSTFDLLRNL